MILYYLETSHYCECHEGYIDGSFPVGYRIDPMTGLTNQGTGKGPIGRDTYVR